MKQIFGLFLLLFLLLLSIPASQYVQSGKPIPFVHYPTATVRDHSFRLIIAKTSDEKVAGLSKYTTLPQDQGMLFQFDTPDYYGFWMKNMHFPIDIIYIRDTKVVTVFESVAPAEVTEENPAVYRPDEPSNVVLEINAGLARMYGIQKGDEVLFSL